MRKFIAALCALFWLAFAGPGEAQTTPTTVVRVYLNGVTASVSSIQTQTTDAVGSCAVGQVAQAWAITHGFREPDVFSDDAGNTWTKGTLRTSSGSNMVGYTSVLTNALVAGTTKFTFTIASPPTTSDAELIVDCFPSGTAIDQQGGSALTGVTSDTVTTASPTTPPVYVSAVVFLNNWSLGTDTPAAHGFTMVSDLPTGSSTWSIRTYYKTLTSGTATINWAASGSMAREIISYQLIDYAGAGGGGTSACRVTLLGAC